MVTYNDNSNKLRIEIKDECPDFYVSKLMESLTDIIFGMKDEHFNKNRESIRTTLLFLEELLPDTGQVLRGYAKDKKHEEIAN